MPDSVESDALQWQKIKQSALAGRQEGVLHRDQLRALGLSDKQILWRVRHDALHEIYGDVFAVGHRNISKLGHLVDALLSCGETAFLSHRTAAAVHGLRPINTQAIEITVVGNSVPRRPGLIVHRTHKPPHKDDLRARGPLRFSSVARMFLEIAAHEKPASSRG